MKYNVFSYLLGEGFRNVLKNKKSTVASIIIMCATMIIFGVFFAIGQNVNNMVDEIEHSQGIQVFFRKDATEEQVKEIGEQIKALNGVNTTTFVSSEEGLNKLKSSYKDKGHLLDGYETILPLSYVVTFTDLSLSTQIQEQIMQLDYVSRITSNDVTTNTLMSIGNIITISTGVILVFLIVVSIFIISNTIKLTVDARQKEISIMKYVGATNSFIRWPFIVEGIVIGMISAIISLLVIGGGYSLLADKMLTSDVIARIGVSLLGFDQLFGQLVLVYCILGIGIGIIGSMISMRRYLKV